MHLHVGVSVLWDPDLWSPSVPFWNGWERMVSEMMNYGYGYSYAWIIALVIGLIVVAIAIYAVVQLGRGRTDGRYPPRHEKNEALEILNRRYANGDISDEEYERMKKRLENRP